MRTRSSTPLPRSLRSTRRETNLMKWTALMLALVCLTHRAVLSASAAHLAAYSLASTVRMDAEVLLWAEWTRAADGVMEFTIATEPNASLAAKECAARLTASIPPTLRGTSISGVDPYYNILPNPSGSGAALTVVSTDGPINSGRLLVWPSVQSTAAPLVFDAPGKWLSEHHVVLSGEHATVVDVRAPTERFVFKGALARNVRAANDGKWLVIDPSGTVGIGQLDFQDPAWYASVRRLPLDSGAVVCDASFGSGGSVVVTQESSTDGPRFIRAYTMTDGAWTKVSQVQGWWHPTDTPGSIRMYENGVFMDGGRSICLANSKASLPPFPAPYHRLRVSDAGVIETTPWTSLGLELGADPYSVSPSGLIVVAKRKDPLTGNSPCKVVRVGPLREGEARSYPAPDTPNLEAWFRVME
jgi:hypothetical protein